MAILIDQNGTSDLKTGEQKPRYSLQEQNRKKFKEGIEKVTKQVVESTAKAYKINDHKRVFDFTADNFSINHFREAAYALSRKLSEAQAEGAFGQLLRAGVQNTFNDIYQAVEVTYDAVVRQTASNKRQEFFAPLERVGFPKTIPAAGSFPETNFKGIDIELINNKYGMMLSFERELMDDDMTGQIVQRAQQMGENARIQEEAVVWNVIANYTSGVLDGEKLPVSNTYSTVYSTTGINGTGNGINATTAARLSQSTIQAGWILAKKMLDSSGRPMVVTPKILAVSPQDVFYATQLLSSEYNPSEVGATRGAVGGAFSVNPIKNLTGILATRFVPDYTAILIDPSKGFAFQRRDAQEVTQENPQSGPAFSQEVFRYKLRSRWVADFIDPKFFINLNSTWVTS